MRKINIQNQLRLFMHSLKYNIYIIEIIHHTLDVIYISIEYIIFIYLYMYIISVCILNIAPCYLYYITDSVSMRVLCPYLGYTPIKKISHPNITSDIWACLKIFGVLEYGSSLHISKLVTPKTTAQLSNPTTVLPDRSNNGNTSSIAVRAPTGLW